MMGDGGGGVGGFGEMAAVSTTSFCSLALRMSYAPAQRQHAQLPGLVVEIFVVLVPSTPTFSTEAARKSSLCDEGGEWE